MKISKIILRNVACRKLSTSLTSISVALGVGLFVAIGSLRQASEQGFQRTAAICDTIVGAKGDSLQLSLNTLYHMGFSAGNISLDSFNEITNQDGVQWAVPVSSGDSYRGHRIVGVSSEFFDNVRIGGNEALGFSSGQAFEHSSSEFIASHQHLFLIDDHHDHDHGEMHQAVFKAVIGADVAQSLNLTIGDSIVPSHGVEGGADHHEEAESKVVGILQKTGTPIDRAIYIPILAYYLMAGHGDDESGEFNGTRDSRGISAIMMSTKAGYYRQQIYRSINNRLDAMAVFPSVEMRKLFSIIGSGDLVLRIISLLVIVVALAGVLVAIYNSMGARRKEFAVLRALGASRSTIITIVTFESSVIAAVGAVIGLSFAFVFLVALSSHVHEFSGVKLHATIGIEHLKIVAAVIAAGGLAGLVPALEAYRTDAATQLSSNA